VQCQSTLSASCAYGSSVRGWGLTSWGRGPAARARGWRVHVDYALEPARRAGQTRGPQHNVNDAASKDIPRRGLLAETGLVGGDSLVVRGSLESRGQHNGRAPRTHRRRVDGTRGRHGWESKVGKVSRVAEALSHTVGGRVEPTAGSSVCQRSGRGVVRRRAADEMDRLSAWRWFHVGSNSRRARLCVTMNGEGQSVE
jgi:hypothetical protein